MGDLVKINESVKVGVGNTDGIFEYRGQRVVTLQMIDELHQRPEGTARDTFNRRKDKFKEDIDFFRVNYAEWKGILNVGLTYSQDYEINQPHGGYRGPMVFLTERGYLKLVKVFDDDLSWEVQVQLVDGYFRYKEVLQKGTQEILEMLTQNVAWTNRILQNQQAHMEKQFFDLGVRVDSNHQECMAEIARLRREFEEALKRRLEPTLTTKRKLIEVLFKCFAGLCPMCGKAKILDAFGQPISKDPNNPETPYYQNEHRHGSHNKNLEDVWPTCNVCNWQLYTGEISKKDGEAAFENFHLRRRQLEANLPKQITIFGEVVLAASGKKNKSFAKKAIANAN